MKTMCPPGYHRNGFVTTQALGHKMHSCHKAIVVITGRAYCFYDCIYIMLILLLWDLSTVCRGSLMTTYVMLLALACWALFGSLVPAMCNCASCAQVHELPQSYCDDKREGTLFSWLDIYIHTYIWKQRW